MNIEVIWEIFFVRRQILAPLSMQYNFFLLSLILKVDSTVLSLFVCY